MPELHGFGKIQAVFFDAVGTVLFPVRSAPTIYAEAALRYGLTISTAEVLTRFNAAFMAEEAVDATASWVTSEERERDRWQRIVSSCLPGSPPECFHWLYDHFAKPESWQVPAEAVALFTRLNDLGLQLGLASNYDRRLHQVLAGRNELELLRPRVVVSSVVGVRKPSQDFFAQVITLAGCRADEILYIGDDRQNDYEGARSAGLQALLLDERGKHTDVTRRIQSLTEVG